MNIQTNGNHNNNNSGVYTSKKFLFISKDNEGGDIAWQVKKEGNEVKFYIANDAEDKESFDGFIDKVDSWEQYKDWADVIIFDDMGYGELADKLRKHGKLVVGCSSYTDRLEEDREFGQNEMKRVGMNTLATEHFDDFNKAIEFLKQNPGRYVFKPSGDISQKDLLFIGKEEDGLDLIEVLVHNKKTLSKKIQSFALQKFVSGVEMAVGAFFNGNDFIYPININFEHKRLFPGELGPFTGEMGTSCYWSDKNNHLFKQTLEKMRESLAESKYVGYIDINCIVNARGIYPLEFTSRFGYPTIHLQMEGILTPMGEFFYKLAKGEEFELKTKKGFQVCVVVAVPPFPFHDKNVTSTYKDLSIIFKKPTYEGIHLGEVKLVDDDWHVTAYTGYTLIVTGSGTSMEESRQMAYNRIKNIILMNMFYRTDIGKRWAEDSDKLQTWGYL